MLAIVCMIADSCDESPAMAVWSESDRMPAAEAAEVVLLSMPCTAMHMTAGSEFCSRCNRWEAAIDRASRFASLARSASCFAFASWHRLSAATDSKWAALRACLDFSTVSGS